MEHCRVRTGPVRRGIAMAICSSLPFLFAPPVAWGDADKIYRENSSAVVVVVSMDGSGRPLGQGSGFVVREDGAVVTNYHVISMAAEIKIKIGGKVLVVKGLLHADPENDIAILKAEGGGLPTVKLGDAEALRVGQKVYVVGSPGGLENTISEGILSGMREIDQKRKILQMTAPISPGSSGGPVFNDRGEVIGIATFLIEGTQNLNFAMPVNLITPGLLNNQPVAPQEACQVDFNQTAACWYYQGLAYGSIGQYDQAAEAFKRSLTIDPGKLQSYMNLGLSYANLGKFQEAAEMFTRALKVKPDQPQALAMLGVVHAKMGRYAEAVDDLKRSSTLEPRDPGTFYHLARTYGKMDRKQEAMEAVKEAIRLEPKYPEAHGFLGDLYSGMKMYSEAVRAFQEGIRLNPDDPASHFGLGKVYVQTGERSAALDEYKMLKKINPKLADQLFELIYKE
jgi:Flp pilus assembly protein TadD